MTPAPSLKSGSLVPALQEGESRKAAAVRSTLAATDLAICTVEWYIGLDTEHAK
jgi:hypothetical protein